MALGVKYQCTVGDVQLKHQIEASELIEELITAIHLETNIMFPTGVISRLLAYTKTVAHFPSALKEFEVSNHLIVEISHS